MQNLTIYLLALQTFYRRLALALSRSTFGDRCYAAVAGRPNDRQKHRPSNSIAVTVLCWGTSFGLKILHGRYVAIAHLASAAQTPNNFPLVDRFRKIRRNCPIAPRTNIVLLLPHP